jgi:signal peptidase I
MTACLRPRWILLGLALAAALIGKQFYGFSLVVGDSMTPTLRDRDLCLLERTRDYRPRRGDIVSFRTADDPPLWFIKRVVGLPGETVAIVGGVPVINGQPLSEPYTTQNPDWEMSPVTLGPDQVLVLSDNRRYGVEDYVQGRVATRLIRGRLLKHWRWRN